MRRAPTTASINGGAVRNPNHACKPTLLPPRPLSRASDNVQHSILTNGFLPYSPLIRPPVQRKVTRRRDYSAAEAYNVLAWMISSAGVTTPASVFDSM